MVASLDRVRVIWEGTGTGSPISLGGAISARFAAPTSSLDGEAPTYLIEHQGEGIDEVEFGRGVYTHSGATLARTEIIWSTNGGFGGSAVDFSAGVKHITFGLSVTDLQGRFISALPELATAIAPDADFLMVWDATDQALKKIKPANLPGAGGVTAASEAEAQAGVENTKYMTSLRVAQAIIAQTSALALLQHNLTATAAPDADDDTGEGYSATSLWFDLTEGSLYFCVDPSEGAAVWQGISNNLLGALASLAAAPGNRMHWGLAELDATSGNVEFDGSDPEFVVRVHGTPGTARNLTITPAPTASFPSRSLLVINDSDGDVAVIDHAASTIGTLAAGTWQSFDWASSAWTAGAVFPGGSGSGITAVAEDVAPVDVGDGGTLTAADHREWYVSGSTLRRRKVRLRHASNQASAVTVTVEDGLTASIMGTVAADQTGLVTIQRDSAATINGGTSETLPGPGASFILIPGPTNVYNLEGELDGPMLPLAGGTITGPILLGTGGSISDAGPIAASGALTKATHGGRAVLTSGNVTIPNASGDVGMGGIIILGGSHTITFNSTVTATLAAGDVFNYYVQSTTVLRRSLQTAATQPAMS